MRFVREEERKREKEREKERERKKEKKREKDSNVSLPDTTTQRIRKDGGAQGAQDRAE